MEMFWFVLQKSLADFVKQKKELITFSYSLCEVLKEMLNVID